MKKLAADKKKTRFVSSWTWEAITDADYIMIIG